MISFFFINRNKTDSGSYLAMRSLFHSSLQSKCWHKNFDL